jgi:ABC-type phosphate/phosphonate transport system substrate-binding protein
MIVADAFPMYDLPALSSVNEALLTALRALLREEGATGDASVTQICGYPLRTVYRGRFTLLGTPCYRVPGCDGASHRAFVVVPRGSRAERIADLRGQRFALNSMHSNTGMNLPRHLFARFAEAGTFFGEVIETGTHHASIRALLEGRADAASIDCVTFALHADYEPGAIGGLRILAQTSASPSIPFVTSSATERGVVRAMRRALVQLSAHPDFAWIRRALRIGRIQAVHEGEYDVLLDYEAEAAALGYPRLA